jgi:hypothetical protein
VSTTYYGPCAGASLLIPVSDLIVPPSNPTFFFPPFHCVPPLYGILDTIGAVQSQKSAELGSPIGIGKIISDRIKFCSALRLLQMNSSQLNALCRHAKMPFFVCYIWGIAEL